MKSTRGRSSPFGKCWKKTLTLSFNCEYALGMKKQMYLINTVFHASDKTEK